MPKVTITEAVQVGGRILVPGEQELSQGEIDTLTANGREHFIQGRGTAAPAAAPSAAPSATAGGEQEAEQEPGDPLADFPAIVAGGYTAETARAASDDELLMLPGVGKATVARLREALAS